MIIISLSAEDIVSQSFSVSQLVETRTSKQITRLSGFIYRVSSRLEGKKTPPVLLLGFSSIFFPC